jgi:hypothetical protein
MDVLWKDSVAKFKRMSRWTFDEQVIKPDFMYEEGKIS